MSLPKRLGAKPVRLLEKLEIGLAQAGKMMERVADDPAGRLESTRIILEDCGRTVSELETMKKDIEAAVARERQEGRRKRSQRKRRRKIEARSRRKNRKN